MMNSILAASDTVFTFGGPSMIILITQVITLIVTLGSLVLGVYIAVLLIKFLRRGIKVYDIQIEEFKSKDSSKEDQ